MQDNNKTKELIAYLIGEHPNASVTALMKLCYLIDLVFVKEGKPQLTNFEYIRYRFGPFDKKIYQFMEQLTSEGLVAQKQEYTTSGKDFIIYELNEENRNSHPNLSEEETSIIKKVISNVVGHGAKGLTQIAYKTKPMIAIGAEMDNDSGLFHKLNLNT